MSCIFKAFVYIKCSSRMELRNFLLMSLVLGLSRTVHSKVFEKCELAFVLAKSHNISVTDVGALVCIAEHESKFNTKDLNDMNHDSSKDYGLFHLNERFWCGDEFGKNICNTTCESFLDDDLTDDLACVEEVKADTLSWKDPEDGYVAWASYENRCKIQNLTDYMAECEAWSPSIKKTTVKMMTTASSLSIASTTSESTFESMTPKQHSTDPYISNYNLNKTTEPTVRSELDEENFNITSNEHVGTSTQPPNSTDTRVRWTDNNAVSLKYYRLIQNWLNSRWQFKDKYHL